MLSKQDALRIASTIPGQTWVSELSWLLDTARSKSKYIEIGTYCGRSLFAVCAGMGSGEVICVDNFSESFGGPPISWVRGVLDCTISMIEELYPDIDIKLIDTYSVSARLAVGDSKSDLVFIDGSHDKDSCVADILSWDSTLSKSGILCGHDYWPNHWGVMDAVNETFQGRFGVVENTRIWYQEDRLYD